MSLIGVKNEQNPAVFVQVRYRERDEIGCLRLPTSAAKGANNAQKMSQFGANNVKKKSYFGAGFIPFPPSNPSISTGLTASISTRWSQVVSRPYFNKKRGLLASLTRVRMYIYYI